MTPEELQQQEDLGRKIAEALAQLGLSRAAIQNAASSARAFESAPSSAQCRTIAVVRDSPDWARAAGVAAYFEAQNQVCSKCRDIGIVVDTDPKETYNLHSAGEPCDCPEGEPYR